MEVKNADGTTTMWALSGQLFQTKNYLVWVHEFQRNTRIIAKPEWEKDGLFEYVCQENNRLRRAGRNRAAAVRCRG